MPMAYEALWHEYKQMPVVTRAYTTACVITTLAVVLNLSFFFFNPVAQPRPLATRRASPNPNLPLFQIPVLHFQILSLSVSVKSSLILEQFNDSALILMLT